MQGKAWKIVNKIMKAKNEDEIFTILITATSVLNFLNARIYDAHNDPISQKTIYVLRDTNKKYKKIKVGYLVYDATIKESELNCNKIVWDCSEKAVPKASKEQKQWIFDLELNESCWVDVPLVAGNEIFGLWALDRLEENQLTEDEEDAIKTIAQIAGLKLLELRLFLINEYTKKLSDNFDKVLADNLGIVHFLKYSCEILSLSNLSFFRLDNVYSKLKKEYDVRFEDQRFITSFRKFKEDEYDIGQSLTGKSWDNKKLQYVPDCGSLIKFDKTLINENLKNNIPNPKHGLKTIIHQFVDIPGFCPGFLRAVNRSDNPSLLFSVFHQEMLKRVSSTLAKLISIKTSAKQIDEIWFAFSDTLEAVRNEGLNYNKVSASYKNIGFPSIIITNWSPNGRLTEVWSNDKKNESRFNKEAGRAILGNISDFSGPDLHSSSSFNNDLKKLFCDLNIDLLYVVPTVTSATKRIEEDHTLVFVPLKISSESCGTKKLKDEILFWKKRSNVLRALDLLGRFVGTIRELIRNRNYLYLAEEAIGTIGHEIRSPAASIINHALIASDNLQKIILQWPVEQITPEITETKTTEYGYKYLKKYETVEEISRWNQKLKIKLDYYSHFFNKVVDNAIRWARLGGKKIEVHYKKIHINTIIKECINELQPDIDEKGIVKFDIRGNVNMVPNFSADPFLIHILFLNLLDNAIKYSHIRFKGKPIEIKIFAERQPPYLVDIKIQNWGLGIDTHDYESIFSNFYRSSVRDRVHTVRGVGLGLATCKKIVTNLHKGEIWVDSIPTLKDPEKLRNKEGYLTTFTIRLPLSLNSGRFDIEVKNNTISTGV